LGALMYTPAPRTELEHTHICAQSLNNKVLTSNIKI